MTVIIFLIVLAVLIFVHEVAILSWRNGMASELTPSRSALDQRSFHGKMVRLSTVLICYRSAVLCAFMVRILTRSRCTVLIGVKLCE